MLKEKNPLLKLKLEQKKPMFFKFIDYSFEALYGLYDFILDSPVENFWYECIIIILSYLQLISLMFDETVSIINYSLFFINFYIVFIYLESN